MNNRHIETRNTDNLIISKCLVCGDANAVGVIADDAAKKGNAKWFAGRHEECGKRFSVRAELETKAAIEEVLSSKHVQSVQIGLDEEYGSVRIYSAITRDNGIPHFYRVRAEDHTEDGELFVEFRCNCRAVHICRHICRVADEDAKRTNFVPDELANYSARKKAA